MKMKIIATLALSLLCQLAIAETCPTIKDIKANTLADWKAFDTEGGTPSTADRLAQFKKYASRFAVAEWSKDASRAGTVRCYYRDKDGSDLGAYLSKNDLTPNNAKNRWYQVTGSTDCAAGTSMCEFNKFTGKEQLATK